MRNLNPDCMKAEDWKAMYMIPHHAISDAVDRIGSVPEGKIAEMLTNGLTRAEEYYITVDDAGEGAEPRLLTQAEIDARFGFD